MKNNLLLVGYGSIGRRHAANLSKLGITPYILTKYPDKSKVNFLNDLNISECKDIEYCIISSPTARHLYDLRRCVTKLDNLKRVLIEKPLERSYSRAMFIRDIAESHRLKIFVGYNLRFMPVFEKIKNFIKAQKSNVKIVEVTAGYCLRSWRPEKDIGKTYSAYRKLGGGVDLDLSHEIDYILWLFKGKIKNKFMHRAKISHLKIAAPDIFKLVLIYDKMIIDISLDYIRKRKERHLRIICDNGRGLFYDFVSGRLTIDDKLAFNDSNAVDESYERMLRAFLCEKESDKLCSVKEGVNVLRILEV